MREQGTISAISICAPWAQLIATCGKDVENRAWPLPEGFVGQWVAIHVAKGAEEWKERRAMVQADNGGALSDELWNSLVTHYSICDDQSGPPDAGRIIALAYVRGCVFYNPAGGIVVNGAEDDEPLKKALSSPWSTKALDGHMYSYGHVYGPVVPLPRAVIDDIGNVRGLKDYWAVPVPVASKLLAFWEVLSYELEQRRAGTALTVVAEPCDDGKDCTAPTDRCPTCGYSSAEEYGEWVDDQFYCSGHMPKEDYEEPTAEQPPVDIDSDGVVQDDDAEQLEQSPPADRYAEPAESGEAQHGGIIGRYWCGETNIGATQVIGVGLWRVTFSAAERPDGCHMQSPEPGELVQRKRKPDDASRHLDCFLVPKLWTPGCRGFDELQAGNVKDGDGGVMHLGLAEILTEQATASGDGNSELWRWTAALKSTPAWVQVLLARGKLQLAFYLVQLEIKTEPAETAPPPPPAPAAVAQQELFPAAAAPAVEPAPPAPLQLSYSPDVVDGELATTPDDASARKVIADFLVEYLGGLIRRQTNFGWALDAIRRRVGRQDVDSELVIDAILERPAVFAVDTMEGDARAIQVVRLAGPDVSIEDDDTDTDDSNRPGSWHRGPEVEAELLRSWLLRRAGRQTIGACRIYGTGALRTWPDSKVVAVATANPDLFTLSAGMVALVSPSQADLDEVLRELFKARAAEFLPIGNLIEALSTRLKVNYPEAKAWFERAVADSPYLRRRDRGFGFVWTEVSDATAV